MSWLRLSGALTAASLGWQVLAALAQPSSQEQQDWSGTWNMSLQSQPRPCGPAAAPFIRSGGQTHPSGSTSRDCDIPFTPKYRKLHDDFEKLPNFTSAKNADNHIDCISGGVPGELEHAGRFEFLVTKGRVTFIDEIGTVRRIWTDGRHFPQKIEPSLQGYSIGHWENGRTLTVETQFISPAADLMMFGPLKVTTKTRVRERFFVPDAMRLELTVSVEDPTIFTHPYRYTRTFDKLPGTFEVGECALYNRDTGRGTVDMTLPPDLAPTPR